MLGLLLDLALYQNLIIHFKIWFDYTNDLLLLSISLSLKRSFALDYWRLISSTTRWNMHHHPCQCKVVSMAVRIWKCGWESGELHTHISKLDHAPFLSFPPHSLYISYWHLLLCSYGVFGANISSQAMLFAKSGLELLLISVFGDDNQFIYPLTWVLVLALIFTAVLQVLLQSSSLLLQLMFVS